MNTPNKPHQKDAPWMDGKYLPPSRERPISNDREHSDRYRRWSPSRRNAGSSRPKNDWKYEQHRERYQNRQHWSYHSKPYRYGGDRRWYGDSYTPNAGPHPSERAPRERADSQQRDVQPSASSTCAGNVATSKSPGKKPSIVIKKVKKVAKPKPGPCGPPAREDFTMNQFLTEHLTNTLFYMPQTSEPMMHTHNALINKIIADEAIKMLSSAASSNEPSSLNEPCDKPASATPFVAPGSSNESTPAAPAGNDAAKPATSATATADSALLQKSAEQVTRKLINQLTTMSKYNLKQMIDNPAGKYETALNKHAQNKLRAEVRKQLKNFNLADAVRAKDSSFGSDVMAPDEAIDAEKIPAELLEQIGKALDFDFYDISGSEPRDSSEGNAECTIVVEPSANKANANEGASAIQQAEQQPMETGSDGAGNVASNEDPPNQLLVTGSAGVEAGPQPLPAEPTPAAKTTVSFLRVSTVDELNKRIETSAEDIAAIGAIPQPTLISLDMLATSGAMVIPEIGSTLSEPTVSSLVSGAPRNASNVPLECPPLARFESFSLPSVQSSSTVNPTQIEPSVAVASKGPAPQLPSQPGKTPNKGKQKPSPPLNCGSQENNSPTPGKKKTKGQKKNPKQNPPNGPPAVENGTTAASAETIIKQPKPAKKSAQRTPPLMPFPPTGSVSICESYSWPNNKPSDGADTSAPNDHGTRGGGDSAKQPSPKATSKVPRWDRENVVRSAPIGATNGECNLRTKTPEPVPISSRSPQLDAMRNGNGKRGWRGYPLGSKFNEQRTNSGTKDGSAGKNSTSWRNSPKRRRDQGQAAPPPEGPTAGNVGDESEGKEAPVQPENEAKQDNGSEGGKTTDEKEQGTGTDIRISNVRSLVDATPPPEESENSLKAESNVSSVEHTANANATTSVTTNEHATDQVVLNGGMQLAPGHANGLGVDNATLTQPDEAMGEMIVPELMSAPRPPLVTILDQMQSLDTQTMELFKRKMELDAEIMKLNGERMEIDQAIVELQNARDEQMNTLRFALFLPFSSAAGGVQNNCPPISVSLNPHGEQSQDSLNIGNGQVVDAPQNTQPQQAASNHQQERTIRRITKISGNSELMRIFQRRRLLSERSSDENPPADDSGSIPNDLPMMS